PRNQEMTHRTSVRLSKLSLALVAALAAAPVFAQSTSAGLGGTVVGADGQPVAGAEVTIVHVESGTTSRAQTDASGNYAARGLRVGGPYTITINKAGEGATTRENVRSEEHTSELQSRENLVCRLLLEKKKITLE